jgi:putative copper export protein
MAFLALVVVPVVRRPPFRENAPALFHAAGLKFRTVGWVCLALFVLSGLFNLHVRAGGWAAVFAAPFWQGAFGQTLAVKLALFGLILILSGVHDFYIGPRARRLWQQHPDAAGATRLRRRASWFGRLNLLLGLIVVYLAVGMVRGL